MEEALVVTREDPKTLRRMSAADFAVALAADPNLINQIEVFYPGSAFSDERIPVNFRHAHKRLGNEEPVRACFAFAADCAPKGDHIFARNHKKISPLEAVRRGKKILLSLNTDLTNRDINFRNLRDPTIVRLEDWRAEHRGNYAMHSMKTAEQLVGLIRRLREEIPRDVLSQNLSVLHRGAVMGYDQFYVGSKPEKIVNLYDRMFDGVEGMPTKGRNTEKEDRIMGFPRLLRFIFAKTTLRERGTQGLRSAPYASAEGKIINQIVIRDHCADDPISLVQEWEKVFGMVPHGAHPSFYVLAAPMITAPEKPVGDEKAPQKPWWRQVRWVVNDMDAQLARQGQFQLPASQTSRHDPQGPDNLFASPHVAA